MAVMRLSAALRQPTLLALEAAHENGNEKLDLWQGEISFIQNTEFRCTLPSVSAPLFQKAAMISLRPQNDPEGRIL